MSMHSAAVENAEVIEWSGDAYRLIPSRFPPVNVYEGLIANDRLDDVYAAEGITNPRLRSLGRMTSAGVADANSDPRLQNWNLAPFAYGDPDGTLFFDERQPCLEVAVERQTALAISVAKRERFLSHTAMPSTGLDMRMLRTPVKGKFWDLSGMVDLIAGLPEADRRAIGAKMPKDAQGILYRPVERGTGTAIAILTGDVLQRSVQTVHFRYAWDGHRITLLYVFNEKGTKIEPEALAGDEDVLEAA
jgi:hypothetical protein